MPRLRAGGWNSIEHLLCDDMSSPMVEHVLRSGPDVVSSGEGSDPSQLPGMGSRRAISTCSFSSSSFPTKVSPGSSFLGSSAYHQEHGDSVKQAHTTDPPGRARRSTTGVGA